MTDEYLRKLDQESRTNKIPIPEDVDEIDVSITGSNSRYEFLLAAWKMLEQDSSGPNSKEIDKLRDMLAVVIERERELHEKHVCPGCSGTGEIPPSEKDPTHLDCYKCGGTGRTFREVNNDEPSSA